MVKTDNPIDWARKEQDTIYGYEVGVPQNDLFDWSLFGAVVRNKRRRMGYSSANAFSRTIYNRTRMVIKPESILKIENGRQTVSAMQFMAICMTLDWSPNPGEFFRMCASKEWQEVANGSVPNAWRRENTDYYSIAIIGAPGISASEFSSAMSSPDDFERPEVFISADY